MAHGELRSFFLVTGGTGFIGSNLSETPVNDGHKVMVPDNLSTGREDNFEDLGGRVEFMKGDIREPAYAAARRGDVKHSLADITRGFSLHFQG